ncbi:hypothetical protein EON67_02215 [archaeon]|nr:MAG: hypothetical protein EON67_02215 [archaeon]
MCTRAHVTPSPLCARLQQFVRLSEEDQAQIDRLRTDRERLLVLSNFLIATLGCEVDGGWVRARELLKPQHHLIDCFAVRSRRRQRQCNECDVRMQHTQALPPPSSTRMLACLYARAERTACS